MQRVALVVGGEQSGLTAGDQLLAKALENRGCLPEVVQWCDANIVWQRYESIVIRATWDYHRHPEAFSAWLTSLEADGLKVINPIQLLRWNMHKFYLRDLKSAGVSVVPTAFAEADDEINLATWLAGFGCDRLVIKPAISASAFRTEIVSKTSSSTIRRFDVDMLIQPFIPEIVSAGEWSLIFIGGRFSHAVLKRAKQGEFRVQSDYGGSVTLAKPEPEQIAWAKNVLKAAPTPTTYARIDAVSIDGQFHLMELELIEPELFLDQHPQAANQLAIEILNKRTILSG